MWCREQACGGRRLAHSARGGQRPARRVIESHRSLGYKPIDVRLRCLGQSLVTALTSADLRRDVVVPGLPHLSRLSLSRCVRFTNRFTDPVLDLWPSTLPRARTRALRPVGSPRHHRPPARGAGQNRRLYSPSLLPEVHSADQHIRRSRRRPAPPPSAYLHRRGDRKWFRGGPVYGSGRASVCPLALIAAGSCERAAGSGGAERPRSGAAGALDAAAREQIMGCGGKGANRGSVVSGLAWAFLAGDRGDLPPWQGEGRRGAARLT